MLRFLTAGESHGPGLTVIVEGIPAGLHISEDDISLDLGRRQVGYGRGARMQIEQDHAVIRSGVRHGITMGSPIGMTIENRDWANWGETMSIEPSSIPFDKILNIRPGHADTPGIAKYMQDDARNILERSSARESTSRVAAGAIARSFLKEFGIQVNSHVTVLGGVHANPTYPIDWDTLEDTPYHPEERPTASKMAAVRCADPAAAEKMISEIDDARANGDSLGGVIEIIATGAPIGLGSHIQWDRKLTTKLAAAVMSINAVKGVEFGAGFGQGDLRGSSTHDVVKPIDEWERLPDGNWKKPWPRKTNNSGGLEGGMTTGEPVVVRAVVKPIATIINGLPTVDLSSGELVERAHFERSDITFVPTCATIGESMVALVLAEALLEKFGGDHIEETKRNWKSYMATTGPRRE